MVMSEIMMQQKKRQMVKSILFIQQQKQEQDSLCTELISIIMLILWGHQIFYRLFHQKVKIVKLKRFYCHLHVRFMVKESTAVLTAVLSILRAERKKRCYIKILIFIVINVVRSLLYYLQRKTVLLYLVHCMLIQNMHRKKCYKQCVRHQEQIIQYLDFRMFMGLDNHLKIHIQVFYQYSLHYCQRISQSIYLKMVLKAEILLMLWISQKALQQLQIMLRVILRLLTLEAVLEQV